MSAGRPVSSEQFRTWMDQTGSSGYSGAGIHKGLAVAVSGGADSMALAFLLHRWGVIEGYAPHIHILSVDHGLRPESAQEAEMVATYAASLDLPCQIFKWDHDGVTGSVQEKARAARYDMMTDYCRMHHIPYLFLAHHRDDQAETFLFRLAKGSGLDGLCGMKAAQTRDGVMLVRPLLDAAHDDLVATCRAANISWAEDPSNLSDKYMRGRLRGSREILEREGLSSKRLGQCSLRLERARSLIEQVVEDQEKEIIVTKETDSVGFIYSRLCDQHPEVVVRLILRALTHLAPERDYPPRLEEAESLAARIVSPSFRGATLGGMKFSVSRKLDILTVTPEI